MCNKGLQTLPSPNLRSQVGGPRRRVNDRGSWFHFLTNSFHGVLGLSSLIVTIFAWIHNEYTVIGNGNVLSSLILPILSVIFTTVLSVHSSTAMLEKSPHQSTILDYELNLQRDSNHGSKKNATKKSVRIKVVAPHREAFHRTSIIMQYANSRILLLLQRRYRQTSQLSDYLPSKSGTFFWVLVTYACLRMLPTSSIVNFFSPSEAEKNPRNDSEKSTRKLPGFWVNGNTYCFVLPMMLSVVADFCMTLWCEYHYFNGQTYISISLFHFHSQHWLSLWHLFFLQVVAHVIAFSFTLSFRIKHMKRNQRKSDGSFPSITNKVSWLLNIRTLYWTCTTGVYILVAIGLRKAIDTINALS